ncbi:MAG: O-antigen ligase family protein [Clostridia bacterium]|nr:O-antigen ligase family protein [Clostridia bacterium]
MRRTYDRAIAGFDLRRAWVWSLLLLVCIPLFPEYIAPFLAVAAFLFARRDARLNGRRVRVGAVGKVLVAYLCFMLVHLLWATDRAFSAFSWLYWAMMLTAYLALTTVLTSRHRVETTLFTLSTIVGMLGTLACAQYACNAILHIDVLPLQLWDFVDEQVYSLVNVPVHLHSVGFRSGATFSNPNLFAQFLVMAIPFVAAYGFTGQRSAAKIFSRIALVLGVAGLCVTFSRGAYLALLSIAIVMCIANIRRLVPMLMVAFSTILLLPDTVYARLSSMADSSDVAILERFSVWGITMQVFLKRPLFGHGIGVGTIMDALSSHGYAAPHAHNVFLEFLVEGGAIGLLILLFLLWKCFRTGFELIIQTPRSRMYGAAVIAFCAGFCVNGMFDHLLFTPKPIGMFMMAAALTDAFGFLTLTRPSCSFAQAVPFWPALSERIESWVKKKTAPKEDVPAPKQDAPAEEKETETV